MLNFNKVIHCNICGFPTVFKAQQILYASGAIDLEQYNWCELCRHTVQGSIKRIKGKDKVMVG